MNIKLSCHSCGQHVVVDSSAGGSTFNCPNCSTQIVVPEVVVQSIPPQKQRNIGCLIPGIVIIAALGIVGYLITLPGSNEKATHSETTTHDDAGEAYYVAKKFCERYAPSATKFTTESGGDYLDGKAQWVTHEGRSDWFASGYVDCQNRYGAMRHQTWGAHVVLTVGKWHLNYLAIGQETFVGDD